MVTLIPPLTHLGMANNNLTVNILDDIGVQIIKNNEIFQYSMDQPPSLSSNIHSFYGQDCFLLAGHIFQYHHKQWIIDKLKISIPDNNNVEVNWHLTKERTIQLIVSSLSSFTVIDLKKGLIFSVPTTGGERKKYHWMNDIMFRVIGSNIIEEYMIKGRRLCKVEATIPSPPMDDSIMITYGYRLMFIMKNSNDLIELENDRTWTYLYKFIGDAIPDQRTTTTVEILEYENDNTMRLMYYPSRKIVDIDMLYSKETINRGERNEEEAEDE